MAELRGKVTSVPPPDPPGSGIPTVYINNIEISVSHSDVHISCMLANERLQQLHMSFTLAKTLANRLTMAIEKLESVTKHSIMDIDEVRHGLEALKVELEDTQ